MYIETHSFAIDFVVEEGVVLLLVSGEMLVLELRPHDQFFTDLSLAVQIHHELEHLIVRLKWVGLSASNQQLGRKQHTFPRNMILPV